MNEVTVKDLLKFTEQAVKEGHGDKVIHLSDDDEGNGFHKMYYRFTLVTELNEQINGLNKDTDIILG